jgi:predicted CXXCH cytochrome family protein
MQCYCISSPAEYKGKTYSPSTEVQTVLTCALAVFGLVAVSLLGLTGCGEEPSPPPGVAPAFVGSDACQSCHQDLYARWKTTLMANVLQDPRRRPEAMLADFATPHPLLTFSPREVVFTYGSKWKQRYFTQIGDDYFVFPAQWDVKNRTWRPYFPKVDTEWWATHYPADPMQRPTGPLCDGCHAVNYDVKTRMVTEWNVGCEKCHGAGGRHVEDPVAKTIVNPAKLDHVRADDVCIQCHSQGQPRTNPIEGRYFDWPVGYQPGDRLSDVWNFEEHHLGKETFQYWPDGSARKNRMQGNDYVQSLMYLKGVRCYACHDAHGTEYEADLWQPGNAVCLTCHQPQLQPGPRGTVAYHTRHAEDSEASQCVACHMPPIARTIGNVNVRSHTFKFISPTMTARYGIPNPCTTCHTDRSLEWASEELKKWPNVSPWRVQ